MIKLDIKPIKELNWKRRKPFIPKKKEVDVESDIVLGYKFDLSDYLHSRSKNYDYQSNKLRFCFEQLLDDHSASPNISILEFVLFPEEHEVDDRLADFFLKSYSLEMVETEPFGLHTKVFFKVLDWSRLSKSLSADISRFQEAAKKDSLLDIQDILRITLVKEFFLHLPRYFDFVQRPRVEVRKFCISIREIAKTKLPLELIASKAQSLGLDIRVKEYGTLKETEIISHLKGQSISPVTLDTFLKSIGTIPEIKGIFLDKISTVSKTGMDLEYTRTLPIVEDINTHAPIVGIIDTGIESNHYTEKSLIGEHGFCSPDEDGGENPQADPLGHGTAVASRLLFGHTLHTHIVPERRALLPVAKILPVKVLAVSSEKDTADLNLDYRGLFDLNGKLAKAVRELKIKIINLSINKKPSNDLSIHDRRMSIEAACIDNFAKKLGVVVVIAAGNIEVKELNDYLKEYGRSGLENPDDIDAGSVLKILPPADFQSGISVGSCWRSDNLKKVYPSWFSRFSVSEKGKVPNMPDCSAIGGDYLLKRSDDGNELVASTGHSKSLVTLQNYGHYNSDDHLFLDQGTSFAAPHVARTLAIAQAQFPEASAETLKAIFLHRATAAKSAVLNKPMDDHSSESITLAKSFLANGTLSNTDELDFLYNNPLSRDELVYAVEGEIFHEKILSYDVPVDALRKLMMERVDHRVRMRISVAYFPLLPASYAFNEPIPYKEANQLHIAACLHAPNIDPINIKESIVKGIVKKQIGSISVSSGEWQKSGMVGWTMDYYGVLQKSFSTKFTDLSWEDLNARLKDASTMRLSVRCHIQDKDQQNTSHRFSAIISFEDIGVYAKTKAVIGLAADLEVN